MKKLILLAGLYCMQPAIHAASLSPSVKNHVAPVSASDRAKAHFRENFSDIQDPAWYHAPDNSLYCIFHQGNKVNRVFYDGKGYWQYTLISYPVSSLKSNVKEMVSSQFKDYQISYINEIRSDYAEPVYVINLENKNDIKVIKVAGDEIDLKQDLKKE